MRNSIDCGGAHAPESHRNAVRPRVGAYMLVGSCAVRVDRLTAAAC